MNNEEINRAIAEHLGWKWFDHPDTRERTKTFTLSDKWVLNPAGELVFPHSVPNYCGDLDAMHEAEKALTKKDLWEMTMQLCNIVYGDVPLAHATAPQRAEAFLRTVGKWKENE